MDMDIILSMSQIARLVSKYIEDHRKIDKSFSNWTFIAIMWKVLLKYRMYQYKSTQK